MKPELGKKPCPCYDMICPCGCGHRYSGICQIVSCVKCKEGKSKLKPNHHLQN